MKSYIIIGGIMRMTKIIRVLVLPVVLRVLTVESPANCARPVTYQSKVADAKVWILPVNWANLTCPVVGGMLRQEEKTGKVVKLADYCEPVDWDFDLKGNAYTDECVAPGTYRYGFSIPYPCHKMSCFTSYYVTVTVGGNLVKDCKRSPHNPGPQVFSSVPWDKNPTICVYQGPAIEAPQGKNEIGVMSGATAFVLGLNSLAFLVGIAGIMRKRQSHS
jgi:hypothetical protein